MQLRSQSMKRSSNELLAGDSGVPLPTTPTAEPRVVPLIQQGTPAQNDPRNTSLTAELRLSHPWPILMVSVTLTLLMLLEALTKLIELVQRFT